MFTLNELLQRQNESLHQLLQIATESPCLSVEQIDGLYILNKYKSCRFGKLIIHHKHYLAPALNECALKHTMLLI